MSSISEDDRKRVFFYADQDSKYYDMVEALTQPCIDLIHDTMVDLVEYSLTWRREKPSDRPFYVLNVASGTGAEALRLLERFEHIRIIAVDFSPPMNREFRRKFGDRHPDRDFNSLVTLLEEDFFTEACEPSRLKALLPADLEPRAFDAAIASFFLHHYPIETKREFYGRAHALLRPGGVLVMAEPFEFESPTLSGFAHDFGDHWIRKQFHNPDKIMRKRLRALGAEAPRLYKEWTDHRAKTHIYAPEATLTGKHSRRADTARVASHASMAIEAGFDEVGFPLRIWEAGILWAMK